MLSDVKAEEVQAAIDIGNATCDTDQEVITANHNGLANAERLAVRQEWAAVKKELKALLAVAERREAKETE